MTKAMTARTLQPSATNAPGGTLTGATFDVRAGFGMMVTARITNGATQPTTLGGFRLEVSHDGVTFRNYVEMRSRGGNGTVSQWAVDVPPTVSYLRSVFFGNVGGTAITCEAEGSEWTTLV